MWLAAAGSGWYWAAMLSAIRFGTALAILGWGSLMILLGMAQGMVLWCAIGGAVGTVGIPLLGSHPWASRLLYPTRGPIDRVES